MQDLRFEYQTTLGRWDLVLEDGAVDLTLVSGTDEIDQRIRHTLRLFKGEWYLDITQGVPYFESILIKGASEAAVGEAIAKALLKNPDVLRIDNMVVAFDKNTRTADVSFIAVTTDGTILIQELL